VAGAPGEAPRSGAEHAAKYQRRQQQRARGVGDEVKPPQDFPEQGARQHAAMVGLGDGEDVEDRGRRNRSEGQESADPDHERQEADEPQGEHPSLYSARWSLFRFSTSLRARGRLRRLHSVARLPGERLRA
jgi:hypothetical protein